FRLDLFTVVAELDTSTVDESHARIVQHDGKLFLQDNKSQRGCFVNGKKVKYKDLRRGDLISIGNVHFEIVESDDNDLTSTRISIPVNTHAPRSAVHTAASWRLISDSSWLSGKVFELQNDTTLLGRGKDCDIVIPGNHLSRRHAQILRHNDYLTVMDLDSANGSYVNETRITGEHVVRPGDRLRFDVYSFRVQGPAHHDTNNTNTTTNTSRKIVDLHSTLQNIEALKAQEYQQKEWITKPTSHGNRYHEVPARKAHQSSTLWVSVLLGAGVLSILGYIIFNI
ncbi:MAG TPA: FHA domain-containing protein, partial [Pseudomonadales bacterium]|nr:FHA domain-containing protein [Pseudomonadales bacterium]